MDYVWDPEWSHIFFINIPNDISGAAINTVSLHKDYLTVTPLTIDATPLNYNTIFKDKTIDYSLNSTIINTQGTLNDTRNLTQQNIQTPSHFINEEIVETIPTTTRQSSSPIHPALTTPHNKNTPFPRTTQQSTVKPSVGPKNSHLDY